MPYQFSDALDDELAYERIPSWGGGIDAFSTASELPADASQYGENIVLRDNKRPRTRPGADALGALPTGDSVLLTEAGDPITTEDGGRILLESSSGGVPGLIQGLVYFDTATHEQLLAGTDGRLFKWEGSDWTELLGWTLNDIGLMFDAAQGVDKLLITDGVQNMRAWDGVAFTDLGNAAGTTTSDPPVNATILCWHTARMFASGKGSESDTIYASKLLDFGTGKWDHVNFKFRVGGGEGDPIKALCSLQAFNLVALKENSVYLVNADPAATTAADWTIEPLSKVIGCVGRKAWCAYQNEVIFMARDGVRSVRRMVAADGQYELSAPLSIPMQPYIDRINWTYAHLIAARNYKELVLFSVPLDNSTTPNVVLAYNARLQVWLGLWTGWTPACWELTRFNQVQRLVFGDQAGLVRQFKDYVDLADDARYLDNGADIPTKLWTRSMFFGEAVNDKDGYHCETRFNPSNALIRVTAVGDDDDLRSREVDVRPDGVDLPVDLPFDLGGLGSKPKRMSLRGLKPFNEIYVKIESTKGWWELRTVTLSAYLNMLQNQ
jgi:hypothetical protein